MATPNGAVTFTYTNYRGVTTERRVVPIDLRWEASQWHPQEQWVLHAYDLDREVIRNFAMKDIRGWRAEE